MRNVTLATLNIVALAITVSTATAKPPFGTREEVLPPLVDAMANFYVTAFSLSDHYMRMAVDEAAHGP